MRAWWILAVAALRSGMQYRGNFLLSLVSGLFYNASSFALIWVLGARLGAVQGWEFTELCFLFGLRLAAHGLWIPFLGAVSNLEQLVRSGNFDTYLLRPASPLVQVATSQVSIDSLAELGLGVVVLAWMGGRTGIQWSPFSVTFLVVAVIGGALIEASLQIVLASLAFSDVNSRQLRTGLDQMITTVGGYPISLFDSVGRFIFTGVVPIAFIAFAPATVLLGKPFPVFLGYAAPAFGVAFFCGAIAFWNLQIRRYRSSGG
ncbi:ABC-2 family transporter protein [Streptosporangium sp. NPDC006007]|uniref:ABC transporter permease n=1 Tax=Streptosporangium sp. NPDC006007 TaxID=3154575 RepID=UPI0033AC5DAA